ncbi:hypothetical protein QVD17_31179 [Tagetes erecta]|uniref:YDG domain-containing protein n=1 Tax=Tagetes erecta TaxID=13708 RepID=A0AAD8NP37_TARER|nr:hypothetical protein QVD17_31179 [Tagetes erecta]
MPRKRALDSSYISKLDELLKHGKRVVPAVRDFPAGCGIDEEERKPVNVVNKVFDSCSKPKEIGGNKASFVPKPSAKVKFLDLTDMKAGFDKKPKVTTTIGTQRKNFDNVGSYMRKMTCNGTDDKRVSSHRVENRSKMNSNGTDDKLVNSQCGENNKLKSFEHKELGRNKSYLDTRSTSKVKFWDPTCVKEDEVQKSEVDTAIVSQKERNRREKIKEAMILFNQIHEQEKLKGEKVSGWGGVTVKVGKMVRQKLKWKDPEKVLGHVCGVQIGDKFKYRVQLKMIGLHCQDQCGIDYANFNGLNLAISIVDSHRYSNDSGSSDKLVYSGHGGHVGPKFNGGDKLKPEDQKLEKGNLALKNSMDRKTQVRVIKKVVGYDKDDMFVYDGLYVVDDYAEKKTAEGIIVFKFYLNRIPGQPSLQSMLKW